MSLVQIGSGPEGPEDIIVTLGHVAPPVVLGTSEEQQALMMAIGAISVRPLCRVSLSRARLGELIGALQSVAQAFDMASGGES